MKGIASRFLISVNFRDTEVMARNQGDIIWRSIIRHGGVDFEFYLRDYLRSEHNLLVGRRTVERIILGIGSTSEPSTHIVRGRDHITSSPKSIEISCFDVAKAIDLEMQQLIRELTAIFEGRSLQGDGMMNYPVPIPPELKPALSQNPVILTGEFGGLRELDQKLQDELGVKIVSETMQV